jgi:gliding motility-associated-like protein
MHRFLIHLVGCCLLLFASLPTAQATHMVGGEINYRCLGNDRYEIMVTVFRDCDTGVPWFDNPASVGVFDTNDSLLYDLRLTLRNNDTLDLNLTDPCLVAPPNVCIHTTTYIDTVTLPFQTGGYQIVYQRCCRNQDIVNIVAPTATGATYSSFVSEEALLSCNSSARFNEWPPVYICAGVPISYDHAATDMDGDSVVYELCTPFTGATPSQSMPQPPNNPPYNNVTWLPPYSVDNMLGGPDSLVIDPQTGLLTGTPDIIGVFVVGVCAKEYRNGQLISTTRRDFQYVVGVCGRLVSSAFFAPEIQCDNSLAVTFQNNSASLGTGFSWNFGDPLNTASSTFANPSYIYPDTGLYTVTLIADPGTLCADTSQQVINLQYQSIAIDFDVQTANCTDSFFLDVIDLTIDSISSIVQWDWDFGNGLTDTVPFPSTVYDSSGQYVVTLNVLAANGCTASYQDTLTLDLPVVFSADSVGICPGDTALLLNPSGNPNHRYQWAPATGLSDPTSPSPLAFRTGTAAQTYTVTVTAPNGIDTCILIRSITVLPNPINTLTTSPDTLTCLDSVTLLAYSPLAQQIEWSTDPTFGVVQYTGDRIRVPVTGLARFFVRATDPYGCVLLDTLDVIKQTTPVFPAWSHQGVGCTPNHAVQFFDNTPLIGNDSVAQWLWSFGDGNSSRLQNPLHTYVQTGNYQVILRVTTRAGCIGEFKDSLTWQVPRLLGQDTVGVCPGNNSVVLNANASTALHYQWSPATGLSSATAASPTATPPSLPFSYSVTITAVNGSDTCQAVEQITVVQSPPITVTVPPLIDYCGDSVTIVATSPSAVLFEWSLTQNFATIVATGNPVRVQPQTRPLGGYYVRVTNAFGCSATAFVTVREGTAANVGFAYQSLGCSDSLHLQFTDQSTPTGGSPIVAWNWSTSNGQFSNQQNPIFSFGQSQSILVNLLVTSANGCTAIKTEPVAFDLANYTGDTTVALCAGNTSTQLNVGGSTNVAYQWSPATGLSSATAASPTATPPSLPFTYTVTITANNAVDTCVQVHRVTLVPAPPLLITVTNDTAVCANVYNMQGSFVNATQVDWSFSPVFSPVAISNVTSFFVGLPGPPNTLTMYVRAFDQYGCVVNDTVRVARQLFPIPTSFTTQINNCEDTLDAVFTNTSVLPAGFQLQSYDWSLGNGQTATSRDASASYTQPNPVVQLTVTATNGCTGTFTDTLAYRLPILQGADSVGLCGADSVQLNVGGDSLLLYQWSPATGLSAVNSASPMARPLVNTTYTVTITSPNGQDTCSAIYQVIVNVDDFVINGMNDTLLCENRISLQANAPTGTQLRWSLDADFTTVLGVGNPFTTYVNDPRWFYLRASSAFGCTALDSVFVDYRRDGIPVTIDRLPLLCGDSVRVQWLGNSLDSVYQWQWDLGNGQSTTLQNPIGNYNKDSTYTIALQVQGAGTCVGFESQQLRVLLPLLDIPTSRVSTCGNDSIQLLVNTQPDRVYQWTPNIGLSDPNSPNPMALPPVTTTYRVRSYGLLDVNGVVDTCWIEDTLQVVVEPAPTLAIAGDSVRCDSSLFQLLLQSNTTNTAQTAWSLSRDFRTILSANDSLSIGTASSQWVYGRVGNAVGCTAVDSILIQNQGFELQLNNPAVLCAGQPPSLRVLTMPNLTGIIYRWSPASLLASGQGTDSVVLIAAVDTVINVVAQNAFGCTDSAMATTQIAPPINLSVSSDSLLCDSTPVLLSSNAANAQQYRWSTVLDFSTVINQNAQWSANVRAGRRVYYVQVEDDLGCVAVDSVVIEYYPAAIDLTAVKPPCTDSSTVLTGINFYPNDNLIYQWRANGANLVGEDSAQLTVWPNDSTRYSVYAQNQYGCTDSAAVWVQGRRDSLFLAVSADKDTLRPGGLVQLMATQRAGYQYNWQSEAAMSSTTIFDPNSTLDQTSTFYVTITDAQGCSRSDSITIYVNSSICDDPFVFVPNAFTPDGDGYNDIIYVEGNNITHINFVIYDRWGEQVFSTDEQQKGWDGTYKGKACPPDVYGYYMICRCLDGAELIKKGNITLLR